ncbi:PHB depolymerase family esterase [Psychrosphaera sp. 1_MG-2023]|uniref:extracellular catalytic domain type 1 short-chain-length polyhydroxyalkanoate depolymerase n=1 Tax=Psychrosphaera sp. 1_MG-2023 TaxID=3062643 RepID=UPI0026E2B00C|nr:PHB depolymerase family esterase [Psychrosphaera sp. 1_MG-2023]MDO6717836.1 PHB depolymerase family esterase [Psychrosphaera sp. 1_MG-2023]
MKSTYLAILTLISVSFSTLATTKFTALTQFGDNPGQLTATYLSSGQNNKALVVLLHGCGQHGETFADQSGLADAAQALGFALLVPQQNKSNNVQLCFNWFSPIDQIGIEGESQSIVNMINSLKIKLHSSDVYIAGLSAGGAMASNLLSSHPQIFKAGAVVSGIGFPCADSLVKAISCMKNGPAEPPAQLAKMLTPLLKDKLLPQVTLVVGKADNIVNPLNSDSLAQSWVMLSKAQQVSQSSRLGVHHQLWQDSKKDSSLELIKFDDFGHGWSVNSGEKFGGQVAPYLIEHKVSTTVLLLKAWKLI